MGGLRIVALAVLASCLQAAPTILFTDIDSGPNNGGPGGLGAPITIYGTGFGTARASSSRVTIGGVEVNSYLAWGTHNAINSELDKIVVQPGPRVLANGGTGDIVVTVNNVDSNHLPYTVRPGNIYVLAPGGSDSNDCSPDHPCATVTYAAARLMQPGDLVYLRAGNYTEAAIQLSAADSGTAGLPKAILAYPNEDAFVLTAASAIQINASFITLGALNLGSGRSLATGPATAGNRLIGNSFTGGVTLSGDNHQLAGNLCPAGGSKVSFNCFSISGGKSARLLQNQASGATLAGISVAGNVSGVLLDGNRITGSTHSGIEITSASGTIAQNNVLASNNQAGIFVGNQALGTKLRNNTLFQNGLSGIVADGAGIDSIDIRNNLFFQTMLLCQTACDLAPLSHIYIADRNTAAASIARNFYQTPQPVIYGGTDSSPVDGAIFFQDAVSGNYRLYTGSAALDAAQPIAGEDHDADGQPRPYGSAADIGAYEFTGVVVPSTPAPTPTPTPTPTPDPTPTPTPTPGSGSAGDPVIFFTDLESGPNTGGENNAGTVVTIYGNNFGTSRGSSTVTIGGVEVAAYKAWATPHLWYQKISVQIGPAARTGNIVVNVNGHASNGLPFVVRPGNIYFLGPNGSDSASGSFTAPWRNAPTARDRMNPGDIIYLLNGFTQPNDDGQGWNTPLLIRTGGTAAGPLTWAAYPGATATIGTLSSPGFGLRMVDPSGYLIFAGIQFRGSIVGALSSGIAAGAPGMRFIANDFQGRDSSCIVTQFAQSLAFHGNTAHDCGANSQTKELEHGVYFSTDTNGIDMGWNLVTTIPSCRGVQVHSSPLSGTSNGFNQYNIRIHHNLIRDTFCDGMVLATVDPSKGAVEVSDNVFLRAGYGTPINDHGYFSCFYSPGSTNLGAPGVGNVEVFNNTMVSCGNAAAGDGWTAAVVNGGQNPKLGLRVRNNIIVASPGVPYSPYGPQTGSNNLYFGGTGAIPTGLGTTADPRFVSPTDFHLSAASPAIDTGTATGVTQDFDGNPRPAGAALDLGAYEFRP